MNPPASGGPRSAAAVLPVSIELVDGQVVRGMVRAWAEPAADESIDLLWLGQQVLVPVARIRSVSLGHSSMGEAWPPGTGAPAIAAERDNLGEFNIVFKDGTVRAGTSHGPVGQGKSGIYIDVVQPDGLCLPTWFARGALQAFRAFPTAGQPQALAASITDLFALLESARSKPVQSLAQELFDMELIDRATLHDWLEGDHMRLRAVIDARRADGSITLQQLDRARARVAGVPEVDANTFTFDPAVLKRIPWAVAAANHVLPLGFGMDVLYVASWTPTNRELQSRLALIAGCHVALVWADAARIEARLARETSSSGASPFSTQPADALSLSAEVTERDLAELVASARVEVGSTGAEAQAGLTDEHSSVVLLVKRMILDAYEQKASDIHIETNAVGEASRVRFRKDGDLEDYLQLPSDLRAAMISRIKVMSRLDISERRRPQDGKINFADFSSTKLELRVAILPTHDSMEDVVMRLLASSKPTPLAKLGFTPRDSAIVRTLAQRPYGLVLACGPTGSGKTTTLHSLLGEINTSERKIWTAEDPIEITQPGLRQLQVNPKIGVTFASAMRAFLRADPDVIMIGEVRDEETARISIEASLTGHLVFSTLHTNNASESIVRLLDLGMDPMNFADSLLGIIAQRLVRALCPNCKAATPLTVEEFDEIARDYVEGTPLQWPVARQRLLAAAGATEGGPLPAVYRAVGCPACGGKGYKGRMGIYEVLENNAPLKRLIETRATTNLIFEQAISSGTRSLKQDALEKVLGGAVDMPQARTLYTQTSLPLTPHTV